MMARVQDFRQGHAPKPVKISFHNSSHDARHNPAQHLAMNKIHVVSVMRETWTCAVVWQANPKQGGSLHNVVLCVELSAMYADHEGPSDA